MPADEASFQLPPPAPPERKGLARAIFVLSALGHVVLFAFLARQPNEPAPPPPRPTDTVRVLRGEVITGDSTGASAGRDPRGEPGLRLLGYGEGRLEAAPAGQATR